MLHIINCKAPEIQGLFCFFLDWTLQENINLKGQRRSA